MKRRMWALAAVSAAAVGLGASAAAAPATKLFGSGDVTPDADYLIGTWGIGAADECIDSDTMAFYSSGAWAVTNGGGNPVEAIGVWSIADNAISVVTSDLKDQVGSEAITATISEASQDKFNLSFEGRTETLFRCP